MVQSSSAAHVAIAMKEMANTERNMCKSRFIILSVVASIINAETGNLLCETGMNHAVVAELVFA